MTLFGCNETHEHTYGDYIAYESGHYHQYTCGCPQPEILEGHIDADENGSCDKCGYTIEEYHTEHIQTFHDMFRVCSTNRQNTVQDVQGSFHPRAPSSFAVDGHHLCSFDKVP